ncbi:MAG: hypothetical protein U5L00_11315 [Desulfovermiculus sp.]|nr:hypothetical protein [Desulfovermiculus sp.]
MTTALSHIRSMNVVVSLDDDGSLDVRAQGRMSQQAWNDALEFAKEFKPEIIQDLKIETDMKGLLRDVGAKIETGPKLVFIPPLDGPSVDQARWDLAMELEGMFWEAYEKGMI